MPRRKIFARELTEGVSCAYFLQKGVGIMEQFTPPPGEAERVVEQYGDMLYRLCLVALGSRADAEDAVQDTLLRYLQKAPAFASREHEKAWLIRVAANRCRDLRRFRLRHPHTGLEEVAGRCAEPGDRAVLEALMSLPEKFRVVLLLHYVEGYSTGQIAPMIGRTPSAVKMRLQKGRKLLEQAYGREEG